MHSLKVRGVLERWLPRIVAASLAVLCAAHVPAAICARRADAFFRGDLEAQQALAEGARAWLDRDAASLAFHTGSARFDGEWYLIVHLAAALGFAQTALEHPELAAGHTPLVARAAERILLPLGRAHDEAAWGEDALASLAGDHGHLAFLGYANLALSMHRRIDPTSRFAAQNDAITEALARRYEQRGGGLLESYPGETYPADNAAAIASITLHDRATGASHEPITRRVLDEMRARSTDPSSGLLFQRVDARTGEPAFGARASGTAMAAFVLGYADPAAARVWWEALALQWDSWVGFGGVREYPSGRGGHGDIDSGPVILGLGVSASAFSLASARRFGDRARFASGFATAWLFGLPGESDGALRFASGGPLGDVLLFALLTARVDP